MLKAAEDELRVKGEQLQLTTEMLRTTDCELKRKEEALSLTKHMLRTAEKQLAQREHEVVRLQHALSHTELALAKVSTEREANRGGAAAQRRTERDSPRLAVGVRTDEKGSAAGDQVGPWTPVTRGGGVDSTTCHSSWVGSTVTSACAEDLPHTLSARMLVCTPDAPQVGIMHGDAPLSMRRKQVVRDARHIMESVHSADRRARNPDAGSQSVSSLKVLHCV